MVVLGEYRDQKYVLIYFKHYLKIQAIATFYNPNAYVSQPMSADPSIPEEFPRSADVGWPMSDEVICASADPSTMEFMAEHYVGYGHACPKLIHMSTERRGQSKIAYLYAKRGGCDIACRIGSGGDHGGVG